MTTSTQTTVNVTSGTAVALIPASPNRVALIVSAPPTNRFTLSLLGTAVLDQGVTLYPADPPLMFHVRDHGDIVTRAWSAISATASQNVTFVSVFST